MNRNRIPDLSITQILVHRIVPDSHRVDTQLNVSDPQHWFSETYSATTLAIRVFFSIRESFLS